MTNVYKRRAFNSGRIHSNQRYRPRSLTVHLQRPLHHGPRPPSPPRHPRLRQPDISTNQRHKSDNLLRRPDLRTIHRSRRLHISYSRCRQRYRIFPRIMDCCVYHRESRTEAVDAVWCCWHGSPNGCSSRDNECKRDCNWCYSCGLLVHLQYVLCDWMARYDVVVSG
jgi:hypothetical protein